MGSIFIEIFDIEVLFAIYPIVYLSRQYGNFQKEVTGIFCFYRNFYRIIFQTFKFKKDS